MSVKYPKGRIRTSTGAMRRLLFLVIHRRELGINPLQLEAIVREGTRLIVSELEKLAGIPCENRRGRNALKRAAAPNHTPLM